MVKFESYCTELLMKRNIPYLRFFGRDENKKRVIFDAEGHHPYFYILESEENKIDFPCDKSYFHTSIHGEKLIKVTLDNPFDVRHASSLFSKTFEADIPYPTKFLIDNKIYTSVEINEGECKPANLEVMPRVLMLDIENIYSGGSNYEMLCPINSITLHDNYNDIMYTIAYNKEGVEEEKTFKFYSKVNKKEYAVNQVLVKDENSLLKKLIDLIISLDPDIFVGWNIYFDLTYILRRLEFHNFNPGVLSPINKYMFYNEHLLSRNLTPERRGKKDKDVMIRGRTIIDLLPGYRRIKWKQLESYRLDEIGKKEFSIGKISYEGWISDFWEKDFDKFLEYNRRDVEICLALDKQYSIIDILLNLRRMSGCELSDVNFNSRIIDIYILRLCNEKYILPSRSYQSYYDREKIEGGFVLTPAVGLFKNIICLDCKSLYPSIMSSFNLSVETLDINGEIKAPNGTCYKKEDGIVKSILKILGEKRDIIRNQLKNPEIYNDKEKYLNLYKNQYIWKTFTNSFYGVLNYPSFRLYNPVVAETITYIGRYIVNKMKDYVEKEGYKVIRIDTDSVFVDIDESNTPRAIKIGKALELKINQEFKNWFEGMNNDTSYFSVKFEKLYSLLFSGEEKKLYSGRIAWDWERGNIEEIDIETKGFAAKRSDRSSFSRNLQSQIFKMLFSEYTKEEILNFIYQEIDKFYNKEHGYEFIGIPKAVTRNIEEYKVNTPWIRGIKWSEKNINGYSFSPKPYLLYVKDSKYNTDVICFDNERQVPNDMIIDVEKMLEVSVYNIIKKILTVLNIDENKVLNYINKKTTGQSYIKDFGG